MNKRIGESDESFKARQRAYGQAHRAANPDKAKESAARWRVGYAKKKRVVDAEWRAANPERMNQLRADWKTKNKDRLAIYKQTRRARKAASNGVLSHGIAKRLHALQKGHCAGCLGRLDAYHLDHIMPLALGGENIDTNIQLLCPGCNLKKGKKHPIDHAQQLGRLL